MATAVKGPERFLRQNARIERYKSSEFKRMRGVCYLDYAATSLYSEKQIEQYSLDLQNSLYGNPHSNNESSSLTTDLVEQARYRVLSWLGTTAEEYSVIFTSGCTASLKLVAECFDFTGTKDDISDNIRDSSRGEFIYLEDNHTSVVGMREIIHDRGVKSTCKILPKTHMTFIESCDTQSAISSEKTLSCDSSILGSCDHFPVSEIGEGNSLFAYPAQSNFNGKRHPLDWIEAAHDLQGTPQGRCYVLLDTASFLMTSELNLSEVKPDFVTISFYKIFGFPTGLGALVVRNSSAGVLKKHYFGGGTVQVSLTNSMFHVNKASISERFEDGTVAFLDILALKHGFDSWHRITGGVPNVSHHSFFLAKYVYHQLASCCHGNQAPVARIYTDTDYVSMETQGPIITFNLLHADGSYIGFSQVDKLASSYNIHLRVGCFCNMGACQHHLQLTDQQVKDNFKAGHVCGDDFDLIEGQPTGAVRISFGYMSTMADAQLFLRFISETFVEGPATTTDVTDFKNDPIFQELFCTPEQESPTTTDSKSDPISQELFCTQDWIPSDGHESSSCGASGKVHGEIDSVHSVISGLVRVPRSDTHLQDTELANKNDIPITTAADNDKQELIEILSDVKYNLENGNDKNYVSVQTLELRKSDSQRPRNKVNYIANGLGAADGGAGRATSGQHLSKIDLSDNEFLPTNDGKDSLHIEDNKHSCGRSDTGNAVLHGEARSVIGVSLAEGGHLTINNKQPHLQPDLETLSAISSPDPHVFTKTDDSSTIILTSSNSSTDTQDTSQSPLFDNIHIGQERVDSGLDMEGNSKELNMNDHSKKDNASVTLIFSEDESSGSPLNCGPQTAMNYGYDMEGNFKEINMNNYSRNENTSVPLICSEDGPVECDDNTGWKFSQDNALINGSNESLHSKSTSTVKKESAFWEVYKNVASLSQKIFSGLPIYSATPSPASSDTDVSLGSLQSHHLRPSLHNGVAMATSQNSIVSMTASQEEISMSWMMSQESVCSIDEPFSEQFPRNAADNAEPVDSADQINKITKMAADVSFHGDPERITLTQICVYPVKSCAPFKVASWEIGGEGLRYDRQWMIITESGICLSQKREPRLACIRPSIDTSLGTLTLAFEGTEDIVIPLAPQTGSSTEQQLCQSKVCGDRVSVIDCGDVVADWLAVALDRPGLRLVQQKPGSNRQSKRKKSAEPSGSHLSLANEAQYLLIHQTSINALYHQMHEKEPEEQIGVEELCDRFRANLVVSGGIGEPFAEDDWGQVGIGGNVFLTQGPCVRCQMICVDQRNGERGKEPLRSLAALRGSKMRFGLLLRHADVTGKTHHIAVGDNVLASSV